MLNYAIYDHPRDYPNNFVVRTWIITENGGELQAGECKLAASLEEARGLVPAGLLCICAFPGDDPVIVETWM